MHHPAVYVQNVLKWIWNKTTNKNMVLLHPTRQDA